ncbi:hypothetical protein Hypma_004081 [Hypsizygus marmoreus]|uniref:Uncharacterized protein n=1 Tax=Hypsizygus marmoreus TaxID=39966 RepID=A0A369K0C7_HYPMA|nr:hypothetical protein Hypma_004081 [Hypsizygus marmoreus]
MTFFPSSNESTVMTFKAHEAKRFKKIAEAKPKDVLVFGASIACEHGSRLTHREIPVLFLMVSTAKGCPPTTRADVARQVRTELSSTVKPVDAIGFKDGDRLQLGKTRPVSSGNIPGMRGKLKCWTCAVGQPLYFFVGEEFDNFER